jgi:hypothetical protein
VDLEIVLFISPQSEYWKQSYITIFDVFSFLGGNFTSLSALFITLPSMIWFNRSYFKNYAIERIEQIENLNKEDSEKASNDDESINISSIHNQDEEQSEINFNDRTTDIDDIMQNNNKNLIQRISSSNNNINNQINNNMNVNMNVNMNNNNILVNNQINNNLNNNLNNRNNNMMNINNNMNISNNNNDINNNFNNFKNDRGGDRQQQRGRHKNYHNNH